MGLIYSTAVKGPTDDVKEYDNIFLNNIIFMP